MVTLSKFAIGQKKGRKVNFPLVLDREGILEAQLQTLYKDNTDHDLLQTT